MLQLLLGLGAVAMTVSLVRAVWTAGAARSLLYLLAALAPMSLTYFGWNDTEGGMWVAWPYYVVATAVLARQLTLLSRRLPAATRREQVATWATPATPTAPAAARFI
ncbi:hypothetical protein [Prescottella subtropica]|uniref:hypothetical protein n=1 Tax=Prescottella subtropica TaxID=2545757 RepID=UPI0010F7BF40|nr:hypothetical protein [Prescottella subtropica]